MNLCMIPKNVHPVKSINVILEKSLYFLRIMSTFLNSKQVFFGFNNEKEERNTKYWLI